MGDWNKQSAPNNNLSAAKISTSRLVGKEGLRGNNHVEVPNAENKGLEELSTHLKSHQPGM
jgi:hypothetical protein